MIHYVVLHLNQNRMDAVGEDSAGHRRKVEVNWATKDLTNSPPVGWSGMVEEEMRFQQANEAGQASGRRLPWE